MKKLLVYVVAYNASKRIKSLLDQIPTKQLGEHEILISDDCSSDQTSDVIREYQQHNPKKNIQLITQPKNLGYGGNQKLGYKYAIKNGFYSVVLLHGDGQYSPKFLPMLVDPIIKEKAEVMLGSRMINKKQAIKGGMPLYKFVANILLTKLQNLILGANLSEFHTGLRAYKVSALAKIPFEYNNNGFSFDTDILIQLIDQKSAIGEISIPTYYGDEISHVPVFRYGYEIIFSTIASRAQRFKLCNYQKFDYKEQTINS